jgi:ribosomal protein L40E
MTEGLLWYDDSPNRDLAQKVQEAADRYHFKFGVRPNLCYVHTSALELGSVQLNGVRLVPADNILRHHFFIGVEESQEALLSEERPRAAGNGRYVCKRCEAKAITLDAEACWNCGYDGKELKEAA